MLRDIFKLLTQPLRDCFKPIDVLFTEWDKAAKKAAPYAQAPYKIEPPAQTSGPVEISIEEATALIRNIDMTRQADADELWRLYGYGSFRREITIHLTHFSADKGGRASALNAKTQGFLGYCTSHDLMDLLARADTEEITSLPNPNYAYISRAVDELMKMEVWEGFKKERGDARATSRTAAIYEFQLK